ncbi:MAG: hypothetical protein Q8K30_02005 [Candidatus Gracilibacteria bacterium]|nr:hypothetical protein [Candidatus Gracilibacteria bacterium]
MNDIYDIKSTFLGLPINITNTLIFLLFIIILYYLLKLLNKKEEKIEIKPVIIEEKVVTKNYVDILNEFEKKYIDSLKDIFYSKLIEILKEIIQEKITKDISKMTFEEINKLDIDDLIKNLIKDIYFKEYMEYVIQDNYEYRKELIDKVRDYLIIKN